MGEGFIQDQVHIEEARVEAMSLSSARFSLRRVRVSVLDELAVQARVGDGHRRVGGQRFDDLLVLRR